MKTVEEMTDEILGTIKSSDDIIGDAPKREVINILMFYKMNCHRIKNLNVTVPYGAALIGVPGTGKSTIAKFCAMKMKEKYPETQIVLWQPSDYMKSRVGGASKFISEQFACMTEQIDENPNIQFIILADEIEILIPRKGSRSLENERNVAMLNAFCGRSDDDIRGKIFFIGTTNKPGSITPDFFRNLRIKPVFVQLPNEEERMLLAEKFLGTFVPGHPDCPPVLSRPILDMVNPSYIASKTKGWTGADFDQLKTTIFMMMVDKEQKSEMVTEEDIKKAVGVSLLSSKQALHEIAKFEEEYRQMQKNGGTGNVIKNLDWQLPNKMNKRR